MLPSLAAFRTSIALAESSWERVLTQRFGKVLNPRRSVASERHDAPFPWRRSGSPSVLTPPQCQHGRTAAAVRVRVIAADSEAAGSTNVPV